MFRPKLETDKGKKKSVEHVEKANCDAIEPAGPADSRELATLEKALDKAERKLNRARSRLEQIEGELLLSEDSDDIEDLREEQKDAKARTDRAMAEYQTVKAVRNRVKARIEEEAKVEAEMKAASEAEEKARRDEAIQRAKEKARREEDLQTATDKDQRDEDLQRAKNKDKRDEDFQRATDKDKRDEDLQQAKNKDKRDEDFQKAVYKDKRAERPEDSCVPVEVVEEEDLGPMPKPRKKFKWTPKKAIAVGLLVCLVLPAVLYGLVIPRADVTVRTWFNEGLLNSITVDAKVINDGTVEVSNLDLNISVMKEVKGVEVHIADLASSASSVAIFSEKKYDSINFQDDENAQYVLEVKVSFDAGGGQFSRSYTHHVDQAYMNLFFNDQVQELAF